jgi:hypothetical protein
LEESDRHVEGRRKDRFDMKRNHETRMMRSEIWH